MTLFSKKIIETYQSKYPVLKEVMELHPVTWINPKLTSVNAFNATDLTMVNIHEAEKLWNRFEPFFRKEFPETKATNGIIESPLKKIVAMKARIEDKLSSEISGNLYLKCDNELSIAGSIKARGGFYEVLHYAESLAIKAGLLTKDDNYEVFTSKAFKRFFQQHSIGVGSTGNLGLSIGIMSAKLGFKVNVYMSSDAKHWKKNLLREKGANVHEFAGDFSEAIAVGRKQTIADPKGYFVDDESSNHLFLGYSTAALRLKEQLKENEIQVDSEHPLFVYLPCGVGGAPGGITFGLKQVFGDNVHCFFVEPVHSPAVLIGLVTGEMERVSVQDFGIDNKTAADGLAVGRPSSFASSISEQLVSGIYTIEDERLFQLLNLLADTEKILVEPSATAGLLGPVMVQQSNYLTDKVINNENVTHIAWSTGGGLVPEQEWADYYKQGSLLLMEK
ncbi:D-serine ammonia-lyase [Oceanobacillus zhaokaii]|uniref:Probable D-serine dehydratase n=1 Tax=Oceanobacillus zhaokaii TaxID=2052660 RepID=A0A345PFX1_9BACI|nr:D-serine ammonia-lyase [Oceanobacillus zhaokaii]AXI08901.1 D-serine ammonia-lyase [Oceanobacillus zhaokaii]